MTELPNWPHWLIDNEDGDYYVRLIDVEARLRELAVHSKVGWDKAKFWHEEAKRLGSTREGNEVEA